MNTADCFATIESRFHDWRYDHSKILYGLIRSLKPMVLVEVGTYRGYSACYMARALQENNGGRLYCIDCWQWVDHVERYQQSPREHWEANLEAAGVREWVTMIEGCSDEVEWPAQVDFAYIDGWHSYHQCKRDCERAMALGAECICLDDTFNVAGPRLYWEELRRDPEWDTLEVLRDAGLGIAMRRKHRAPVLFSQELPDNPGIDLIPLTRQEREEHFAAARKVTGLDYRRLLK